MLYQMLKPYQSKKRHPSTSVAPSVRSPSDGSASAAPAEAAAHGPAVLPRLRIAGLCCIGTRGFASVRAFSSLPALVRRAPHPPSARPSARLRGANVKWHANGLVPCDRHTALRLPPNGVARGGHRQGVAGVIAGAIALPTQRGSLAAGGITSPTGAAGSQKDVPFCRSGTGGRSFPILSRLGIRLEPER